MPRPTKGLLFLKFYQDLFAIFGYAAQRADKLTVRNKTNASFSSGVISYPECVTAADDGDDDVRCLSMISE